MLLHEKKNKKPPKKTKDNYQSKMKAKSNFLKLCYNLKVHKQLEFFAFLSHLTFLILLVCYKKK